jgi:monofunctional biosynthetic peptidoglycan transglycosylase
MVIIGEDSRFRTHHGIDPAEIADALGMDARRGFWSALGAAWRHRDRLRGASTITQQVAKNLYLSTSRNPLRKIKEAVTALRLELALPKDRILELYLTEQQAAELAATLPHPRTSNPTFRPERTLARRDLILARYRGVNVYIPPEEETDTLPIPPSAPVIPTVLDSLEVAVPLEADSAQDSLTAGRTDAQGRTADSGRDSLP